MDYCRPCGCKGRRSCLICEQEFDIKPVSFVSADNIHNGYVYCESCSKAWRGWNTDPLDSCPHHLGDSITIQGIYLQRNFITDDEKEKLLNGMNKEKWDFSQSGRRKQNYGPKCNFKKNKIQIGNFNGFPRYSKFIHDKFKTLSILENFNVIEQCSLEYDPKRGASIDPHIDDCWVWGERIVTVNVLGDTFLTMSRFNGEKTKYNLDKVKSYSKVLDESGCVLDPACSEPFNFFENNSESKVDPNVTIRIFMPEKSVVVLFGSARYEWEHYVLREDVKTLRICLAYREFTPTYLTGHQEENIGADVLKLSKLFW